MVHPLALMGGVCWSCIHVDCICVPYACVSYACCVCMVLVMVPVTLQCES